MALHEMQMEVSRDLKSYKLVNICDFSEGLTAPNFRICSFSDCKDAALNARRLEYVSTRLREIKILRLL